ncbi:hypothetical protein GCM10008090_02720 [Arenicella chitinivorans]|uniref:Peptidase S58 DmpA n=1 Tax=Arenicella chitinivorans TaxID=1329800 RepID=A0A918VHU7_9GAMM|nr:P1 family peptidase [Arenicella chitinivorans]GGZ97859.1 hypothetical protein GCM10008090_02720 [Arenicella chitinivorans]
MRAITLSLTKNALFASSLVSFVFASTNLQAASQDSLVPTVNMDSGASLEFDWPGIRVGTASYEEGPTGVTVFHFDKKAKVAMDVRGGGPGTVNAPYVELGYDVAELDSIVVAGGSWYGLEATTAVATAMMDDGLRDGDAFSLTPSVAMSLGSIIFDFGSRRLNEIYPDKKLAQAAYRAAVPGQFPLGATGAGRHAMTGGFFGCAVHSGQGGAFKQIGDLKIAAFSVVNAFGAVTDRDGKVDACYTDKGLERDLQIKDMFAKFESKFSEQTLERADNSNKNTTISVLVVNQKLEPALLKRLAVQVHTSMSRSLQPYATLFDGDVFYAVSTEEIDDKELSPVDLGVIASEVMWDALLAAAPAQQPKHVQANPNVALSSADMNAIAGEYQFSDKVKLKVFVRKGKLFARATGSKKVFAIATDQDKELLPVAKNQFVVPSRVPLTLDFSNAEKVILNPGHWQQTGVLISN